MPTSIVEERLLAATDEPGKTACSRVDAVTAREHRLLLKVEAGCFEDLHKSLLGVEAARVGVDEGALRHVDGASNVSSADAFRLVEHAVEALGGPSVHDLPLLLLVLLVDALGDLVHLRVVLDAHLLVDDMVLVVSLNIIVAVNAHALPVGA